MNFTTEELKIIVRLLREKEMFYLHQARQDIRTFDDVYDMYMDKAEKLTSIIEKGELCIQSMD